jgi:hypothetical protein
VDVVTLALLFPLKLALDGQDVAGYLNIDVFSLDIRHRSCDGQGFQSGLSYNQVLNRSKLGTCLVITIGTEHTRNYGELDRN